MNVPVRILLGLSILAMGTAPAAAQSCCSTPAAVNYAVGHDVGQAYRIVYQTHPDEVRVLTVFEGHQLLDREILAELE